MKGRPIIDSCVRGRVGCKPSIKLERTHQLLCHLAFSCSACNAKGYRNNWSTNWTEVV